MWIFYVTLFGVCPLLTVAENSFIYTNGWIPVSSETVYNQIKRESATVPSYISSHSIQVINTDINKVLSPENIRIQQKTADNDEVHPEDKDFEATCVTKGGFECQAQQTKNNENVDPEFEFVRQEVHNPFKRNDKLTVGAEAVRRSKKIEDFSYKDYVQQLLLREHDSSAKSNDKTYEVTESDVEDVFEQKNNQTNGYEYEPPKKQNQTTGLFEILSKYKISKDDELPNYALSRRPKTQFQKQSWSASPFRNTPYKYNSLNHLPIDPLLAVFLSNYGFYLQGMYGINNHYNNLYGYLASNNIHNNRPFGIYKVFSDTDSSN